MKKNKKLDIEFSKLIVVSSYILFILTLVYCTTRNFSSILDATVLVSAITSTGTLCVTSTVWYLKKRMTEHVALAEKYMYEEVMKVRLDFIEGRLKLQQKYKITEEDINNLDSDSPLGGMSDNQLTNMQTKLDSQMDDATSPTEIQTVS